jgi:exodeoxyribonuclease V alpha subunit
MSLHVRTYRPYGASTAQVIAENPCQLARDIRIFGFRAADLVAGKLGIEPTAMIRVRKGSTFVLANLSAQTTALAAVLPARVETALELKVAKEVMADTLDRERCVFLVGLYRAELTLLWQT